MENLSAGKSEGLEKALEDLRNHQVELEIQNIELRGAQEELQEVLSQYRDLYDRAPVGYLTLDQSGTILKANLTAATILERERGVLEGRSLASLVHPDDQDQFFLEVRSRLSQETVESAQIRLLDGAGEPFWAGLNFSVEEAGDGGGFYAWCTLTDLTERKAAQFALEDSRDRLRELTARLQQIREEERTFLARELHDGIGQSLAALGMDLAWIVRELGPVRPDIAETLGGMRKLVEGLIYQVSEHMVFLRPPELDILGLSSALEHELASIGRREGIEVSSNLSFQRKGLGSAFQTQVLRIFEEAVSNVLRHSGAERLRVSLEEEDGHLVLDVEDDGRGVQDEDVSSSRSFGIMSMKERAAVVEGVVSIESGPMGGSLVRATFPLPPGSGTPEERVDHR